MDGWRGRIIFMSLRSNLSLFVFCFMMMKYLPSRGQHLLAPFILQSHERERESGSLSIDHQVGERESITTWR